MKQIRTVIVYDEPLARENYAGPALAAHPEAAVVGEACTVGEARKVLVKIMKALPVGW